MHIRREECCRTYLITVQYKNSSINSNSKRIHFPCFPRQTGLLSRMQQFAWLLLCLFINANRTDKIDAFTTVPNTYGHLWTNGPNTGRGFFGSIEGIPTPFPVWCPLLSGSTLQFPIFFFYKFLYKSQIINTQEIKTRYKEVCKKKLINKTVNYY